jgi:hypothetical protein
LRKDVQHVRQFTAGYQDRAPSGTFQRFQRYTGFFGYNAMDCERIVIIGRQCHKKHVIELQSFTRSELAHT